jgi:hypothetical protein
MRSPPFQREEPRMSTIGEQPEPPGQDADEETGSIEPPRPPAEEADEEAGSIEPPRPPAEEADEEAGSIEPPQDLERPLHLRLVRASLRTPDARDTSSCALRTTVRSLPCPS